MIVTVTLNPALQVEYDAEHVIPGESNPVRQVRYRAAGRGLAVARILNTFGHEVVAAGLVGGSAGEVIKAELARAGVATQFTRITAETRRVLMITDGGSGATTSFAEPSPYITTEELGRLATEFRSLLAGATAVVLAGSLPEGLPVEIYGSLISYAAATGVPVVLNATGDELAHGAARQPALAVDDEGATGIEDVRELARGGPRSLAVLTADGARVLTSSGQWRARPGPGAAPPPPSGGQDGVTYRDALVAGFVPGIALSWSWPDTLRHALALAAAWNPVGELDVQAYEQTLAAVAVS